MHSVLHWALVVTPPIVNQMVNLSPVPAMRKFIEAGTTGNVSPVPYVSMAVKNILCAPKSSPS